jgi:hypothetical protein
VNATGHQRPRTTQMARKRSEMGGKRHCSHQATKPTRPANARHPKGTEANGDGILTVWPRLETPNQTNSTSPKFGLFSCFCESEIFFK